MSEITVDLAPKTVNVPKWVFFDNTVELGFKNRQNKNLLDFKNQITNYQIWLLALRTVKIRTYLTLRTKMAVTKKSS